MNCEIIPYKEPRALAGLSAKLPALFLPDEKAAERFFGFFTANIDNKNARRAYYKAACRFADWCEGRGVASLAEGKPLHVAAYIEGLKGELVPDYFTQGRRGWIRLHEKGGKEQEAPCHHKLEIYLDEYIAAAGIAGDDGPLFRTTGSATGTPRRMVQKDAYKVIERRARQAGIKTKIGNHSMRATGMTDDLKSGGTLEKAQAMANHFRRAPPSSTTGSTMKLCWTNTSGWGFRIY